ncbi:LuxR C-terminal-related transcriptional regulator [Microbacterium yannicii]|uniref:LuxR C-terminal-related transcriptional regulator n=1 Tax=Microbacterium yannicii TaxID=671622 RepID=UPI001886D0DA|nr:LuxR C-terminal-related transcriptional regulator [Microbacterium yannicii]MCO5952846.1 LuxR C-terminal-related transcriptional regulator [Microbacterium yannicii]
MSAISNFVRIDPPAGPASPASTAGRRSTAASSPELDAFRFPGDAPRALITGGAGSGKTTLLHRLAELVAEEGLSATTLRTGTDLAAIPSGVLLLVDDAQLLPEARIADVTKRAEDPDAGLIVAMRSWPSRPDIVALGRLLERSRPAMLLGEVTRAQVRDDPRLGLGACGDVILRLTGGIAWLVHECVAAHDVDACRDDPEHHALQHEIRPRILHRLMSVSPRVRQLIDDLSLGFSPTTEAAESDVRALLAEGYAEGLLTADGRPAPAVVASVRAVTPVTRLNELIHSAPPSMLHDEGLIDGLANVRDADTVDALVARARQELSGDPALAGELLDRAVACGADPAAVAHDRALAAWIRGRLDEAAALLDGMLARPDLPTSGPVVDLAAAVWAERGMMSLADDTYRAERPGDAATAVRARIAAVGAGRPAADSTIRGDAAPDDPVRPPSTLGVANDLLEQGLTATLNGDCDTAPAMLQRASELYTASADHAPSVELPAVIAAIAAIGVGDLKSAQTVIDDALEGDQGGAHRRGRLELWSSWIALQRERPADARAALARAASAKALTPRDDAFAATIAIGLARRYDDVAGLAATWDCAQPRLARTEPDLFSLLALGELVIAAARLGDAVAMQPAFDRALSIVSSLGDPPIWSASLHWAGIQRGILLNQPDTLAPHARALVTAASRNRLAARMAHAGKVWTSVLAGTVDPDAVERAARGLATVGLAWDGARLAGHGAGRSEDRKVIARLLACARELHPRETARTADEGQTAAAPETVSDGVLSEREREVAELVLQGKTYAEIGAAIFISPRTAEHHIAHMRRRLDATSRSDLLSKLRLALEGAGTGPADPERRGSER